MSTHQATFNHDEFKKATSDKATFEVVRISAPCNGLDTYRVHFESTFIPDENIPDEKKIPCRIRKAFGRAVVLDPKQVELRIYPFYELIHRSWRPGTDNFVREDPKINLGTSVRQFVYEDGGPELRDLGGERGKRVRSEVFRCVFASNTLQTGFVRGNGFVIARPWPGQRDKPQVIAKPLQAPGRYDYEFVPLGHLNKKNAPAHVKGCDFRPFKGKYDAMILVPDSKDKKPEVGKIKIEPQGTGYKAEPMPHLAFSSPIILTDTEDQEFPEIKYHPNPKKANDPTSGRGTIGNEVNWDPYITCTSFTAFGCTKEGKIVVASMFEGVQLGEAGRNSGILAIEMAHLLKKGFDAQGAVIGGGSADTQQFLRGDVPNELLEAEARPKKATESAAPEVIGPRGLGAIFAVLQKPKL